MTGLQATANQPRRSYDSTSRRELAERTRFRILNAAAELFRESSVRDWRSLTIRSVAQRAEVSERTVYRHFDNEQTLRAAVLQHLAVAAGIDLDNLTLGGVADVSARIIRHVAAYPAEQRAAPDPVLDSAGGQLRASLLGAVADVADGWSNEDQVIAAAVLDVMWSVASYERLAMGWDLSQDDAIRGIGWVIGLIENAVRQGHGPAPKLGQTR